MVVEGIIFEPVHSGGIVRMKQTVSKFETHPTPSFRPRLGDTPKNQCGEGRKLSAQSAKCFKEVTRDIGSPSSRPDHFLKLSASAPWRFKENPLNHTGKGGYSPAEGHWAGQDRLGAAPYI
jgi:hypothetical protein